MPGKQEQNTARGAAATAALVCRRTFAIVLVGVGLAGWGCSTEGVKQSTDTPQIVAPQVRLRLLGESSPSLIALEKAKSGYESSAGVSIEVVPRDHASMRSALSADAAATQGGYDLVIVPHGMVGQLVESGYVQPIGGFLGDPALHDARLIDPQKDLLADWWRELSWYRGQPYGFPFQLRPTSLWYREDLFDDEEEGYAFEKRFGRPLALPGNISELEQVAGFFNRPQAELYGTVVLGRGDRSLAGAWQQYATLFGAAILDSPNGDTYGDIVVNSPEAVRATEYYVGLLRFAPPDARTFGEREAVAAFERRRIAVGLMRHDLALAREDTTARRAIGGIAYAPAPRGIGGAVAAVDGETFLIPHRAPHAREAFAFMQWALSNDAQVAEILEGGLSARLSSFADPRVQGLPKTQPNMPLMHIWMFPRVVMGAVAVATPTVAESDQMADAVSPELSRIVAGEVTPKAGLDAIAVELGRILKGKARLRYPARSGR